jgi:hypothetical protein
MSVDKNHGSNSFSAHFRPLRLIQLSRAADYAVLAELNDEKVEPPTQLRAVP